MLAANLDDLTLIPNPALIPQVVLGLCLLSVVTREIGSVQKKKKNPKKQKQINSPSFQQLEVLQCRDERELAKAHDHQPFEITSHFQAKPDKARLLLQVRQHRLRLVLDTNTSLCFKLLHSLPGPLWNSHIVCRW